MVDPNRAVISLGECLVDLIVEGETDLSQADRLHIRHGGAPANVAVALARLGVPVKLCAVVGRDPFGYRLRDGLTQEGVDVEALRLTSEAATSMALAWKNAHGDGEFQLLRMADTLLSERDVEHAAPGNAAALVLGSVVLSDAGSRRGAVSALDLAVSNNVPVVFDLNFRPFLWTSLHVFRAVVEQFLQYARVIKVSMDDARGVWGDDSPEDAIERLAAYGPTSVVVTDGVRGVWYQNGRANMRSLPVFEADVVEPTGAGDAFTAALTLRMLQRSWMPPDDDDIRFAMAAGALATTKVGAWSGLRSAESVQEFLADRG